MFQFNAPSKRKSGERLKSTQRFQISGFDNIFSPRNYGSSSSQTTSCSYSQPYSQSTNVRSSGQTTRPSGEDEDTGDTREVSEFLKIF